MVPTDRDGPVAIVGLSCRLPKATDPDAYWRLLLNGVDAVTEAPQDRWNSVGERIAARWGGFLEKIDRFDAEFFGIQPREATVMDPQQRLMMELSWEALEDAGIVPATIRGSLTGVFAGAIWDDYAAVL